jgi:hypothetical protein
MRAKLLRRTTTTALIVLLAVIADRHYHRIQWSLAVQANEAAFERQYEAKNAEINAGPTYNIMERARRVQARRQAAAIDPT